jgi:predicted HTH transcriptional regulator
MRLSAKGQKYNFDGKLVLAFFVPSSMVKPIYYGNLINTFIRSGSGDRRATDQIILQRLRNFVDAPYEAHPDGSGAEDESQLYAGTSYGTTW